MIKKESKWRAKVEYYREAGERIKYKDVFNLETRVDIIFYSTTQTLRYYRLFTMLLVFLVLFAPSIGREISMEPTISSEDIMLIKRDVGEIKRGDIVSFKAPYEDNKYFTKRIIGLPGDFIELKDGKVYIDGELLEENYTKGETWYLTEDNLVVPEGRYYVLGDNREHSSDSRYFGTIEKSDMVGKLFIKFPTGKPINRIKKEVKELRRKLTP